jgi:hypothetical protein
MSFALLSSKSRHFSRSLMLHCPLGYISIPSGGYLWKSIAYQSESWSGEISAPWHKEVILGLYLRVAGVTATMAIPQHRRLFEVPGV